MRYCRCEHLTGFSGVTQNENAQYVIAKERSDCGNLAFFDYPNVTHLRTPLTLS